MQLWLRVWSGLGVWVLGFFLTSVISNRRSLKLFSASIFTVMPKGLHVSKIGIKPKIRQTIRS